MAERVKDNRAIVKGVSLMEGATLRTFSGDNSEDLDALERAMTVEQCERLKQNGSLEGDWRPAGKPPVPMQGSKLDRASLPGASAAATKEHAQLIAENERLKAELAKRTAPPEASLPEPEQPRKVGRPRKIQNRE